MVTSDGEISFFCNQLFSSGSIDVAVPAVCVVFFKLASKSLDKPGSNSFAKCPKQSSRRVKAHESIPIPAHKSTVNGEEINDAL